MCKFEKRFEKGKGKELVKRCCEEVKGRRREGKIGSNWEEERKRIL